MTSGGELKGLRKILGLVWVERPTLAKQTEVFFQPKSSAGGLFSSNFPRFGSKAKCVAVQPGQE